MYCFTQKATYGDTVTCKMLSCWVKEEPKRFYNGVYSAVVLDFGIKPPLVKISWKRRARGWGDERRGRRHVCRGRNGENASAESSV